METGKEEHVKAIVLKTGITIAGDQEDRLTGIIEITGIVATIVIVRIIDTIEIVITGTIDTIGMTTGIIAITGTMTIGRTDTIVITGIIENIAITVTIGRTIVIQTEENVGKDVPRRVTGITVFKIGIVTSTGEMIAGKERIGKIVAIVGKDLPNDREDHLMATGERKACTVRKNK